ncbi:MAG: CYTH domain-containing protein, partial [Oscillospiraceae bacterium]|nr:CYTH domain-containing protein [Oscillospiraceae bacterium]
MVENEFKVMLKRGQYETLLALYEWDKVIQQTNYYYDTAELTLSDRHVTCRVRKIGGECFLQIKLPNGKDYSRIELEKKLGAEIPEELSAELLNALAGDRAELPLPDVRLLGALSTSRSVKRFEGAEIDLDKSEYFGKTDYELEIEFTDEAAARAVLAQCTKTAGLAKSGDVCTGKIRRFLEEYGKNGGNELLGNIGLLHTTPMG